MVNDIYQLRINHYCWGFRMHEKSKTAEFSSHRHDENILKKKMKEKKYIRQKNGYRPSRLMRLICLVARVADLSLLRSTYNQFVYRGKDYRDLLT